MLFRLVFIATHCFIVEMFFEWYVRKNFIVFSASCQSSYNSYKTQRRNFQCESCAVAWAKMDSNHRRRKPADLQSAPFGHSGICPLLLFATLISELRCKGKHYFWNFQAKSTIFIAVSANSFPLLPKLPPARCSACSWLLTVNSPKITGISPCALSCAMPWVTPSQI